MSRGTAASDIADYEGLVFKTAQMFHERVGLELDDMRQELRVKVVKALRSYDPQRSALSERSYVYACLANFVKDLKRDAARRAGRLQVTYIEEHAHRDVHGVPYAMSRDVFESRYQRTTHDQVFGGIEGGFIMPATVTHREQEIVLLLVVGYDQTEIARRLGVERWLVVKLIGQLREKLADWKPDEPSRLVKRHRDRTPVGRHLDAVTHDRQACDVAVLG